MILWSSGCFALAVQVYYCSHEVIALQRHHANQCANSATEVEFAQSSASSLL